VHWPGDCETVGRTVNVTLLNSTGGTVVVETLNWDPTVVCKRLDEERSPFREVRTPSPLGIDPSAENRTRTKRRPLSQKT